MKFLVYAVLAYFLLRAVANLMRAMRRRQGTAAGPSGRRSHPRSRQDASRKNGAPNKNKEDQRATRLREEEDVEDARWEDL